MSEKHSSSLLFDPKIRSYVFQILVFVAVIGLVYFGVRNMLENYGQVDFSFLSRPSSNQVLTTFGTWINGYVANKSQIIDVLWVGLSNTLIVAFFGIIFATILGFILGIFRLSTNFILRSFSTLYIETLRNIPLLLQIFFWVAVTRTLSDSFKVADSIVLIPGVLYYNASGLRAPYIDWQPAGIWVLAGAIIGAVIWWAIARWAKLRQMNTGKTFPAFWVGLLIFIAIPTTVFMIMGSPATLELPTEVTEGPLLKRGAFENGKGAMIVPQFIALLVALSTYTAAFIAEIVRAGILAVPKGQSEASAALGLSNGQALRLVIVPQALRVIIPPLTSQYLNLTKNSSLAVAVGYPELTMLFAGIALNQTGRAVEIIIITIAIYLSISLVTSLFMNWFNSRMKLVER